MKTFQQPLTAQEETGYLTILCSDDREAAKEAEVPEEDKWIVDLIAERKAAKKAKDFARADAIREELLAKGVTLIDTREGTKYTKN